MIVKRKGQGEADDDIKKKTVNLRSGELSRRGEKVDYLDERFEKLIKKDRLMAALFAKIRNRFEK